MEYNSFYGGRRGASFIITKSYKTIAEMVTAFKQGGAYKVVDYDDYVLIDTVNKMLEEIIETISCIIIIPFISTSIIIVWVEPFMKGKL